MFTDPEPPQGRTIRSTRGRPVFSIEGEALPLMRSLQRRIAGSSRSTHGMSTNEAQVVLMECCSDAVVTTIKAAVASLVATLESDPGPMTVAETVNGAFLPGQ